VRVNNEWFGVADLIDGGDGTDRAVRDDADQRTGVEQLV